MLPIKLSRGQRLEERGYIQGSIATAPTTLNLVTCMANALGKVMTHNMVMALDMFVAIYVGPAIYLTTVRTIYLTMASVITIVIAIVITITYVCFYRPAPPVF